MADFIKLDTRAAGDYSITDNSKITIANDKTTLNADGTVHVYFIYGKDNKIDYPDAGTLVKFGPIVEKTETEAEHICVPKSYYTIKLPLYRAGEGTCVAIEAGASVILTPTLSEEVVYYEEACAKLGLTFTYVNE